MLDYDAEAKGYDDSRGGQPRADAAAAAILGWLPSSRPLTILDVAGGTGSVAAALSSATRRVVVADLSTGMLREASRRLPGRQVRATAFALPFRDAAVDVVTCIWLLHLLGSQAEAAIVIGEAARVLRPGGRFVTTVDKQAAQGSKDDSNATDERASVESTCHGHGLRFVGEATFEGHRPGQPGSEPVYPLLAFAKGYR